MSDFANFIPNLVAAICSTMSLALLLKDRYNQKKLEKMNLSITPKAKLSNCVNEIFFLNLAFTNESSLPISILDITLSVPKEGNVTDSQIGTGGTTFTYSVPVSESKTSYQNSDIITYNVYSTTLPITLEPYSSFGGYIAFHAGKQDAAILCNKTLNLEVRTSRRNFKIEINLHCNNFYDFSYRHDGTTFGKAVINEKKQSLRTRLLKW